MMEELYHNHSPKVIGLDLDVLARQYIQEYEISSLLGDLEIERAIAYFRNLWADVQRGFGHDEEGGER